MSCSRVSVLQELSGAPVYAAYRYRIKNIPPDLGTHCKPIHSAFQLRTPCRYIQHRPFQPPGTKRLWSHRKSPFTGFGLYASFMWLARKKTYESGSVEESLKIISTKFISCEEGRVGFKSPTFFILETDARNFNSDALTSHRLLRLNRKNSTQKRMTTPKMTAPNKAVFSKTSFMIGGFRMPFNSKYQPS